MTLMKLGPVKVWSYYKVDYSQIPYLHFAGVRGYANRRFFDLSLSWGRRPEREVVPSALSMDDRT